LFAEKLTLLYLIIFSVMFTNTLLGLTSISQWALFLGITLIIFGWIEKKEKFVLAGQLIFLLLGFLALNIILNDKIIIPQTDAIKVSKELKILIYFKSVVLFMGAVILSLFMRLFKVRFQKISAYILVFFAVMLFFMVFSIQQMPN